MLATTTTDTLGIVDSATLKKLPSSVPPCLDLIATPVASAWSPDNTNLFIASSRTIHKYDSFSNVIHGVYDVEGSESIRALISKEKNVIVFSLDHQINILQFHNSETHTVQTLVPHKLPVSSLSLSNDNSLLASASANVVYVHNIASGSHTVLRGLGNGASGSTSVTFHMHFRTRLLVSLARQILVYDTTRPSVPLKTIPLSDSSSGDIVAISCSPFSKTLVAVATSMGFVVMIDLEKDKPQLRTVNIKTNPTALEFSPEGGSIFVGTDDGKLLVVDLRNLDKPAKLIIVSEIGDPIRTLSIQKRPKTNADGAKTPRSNVKTATKTPSEPLPPLRRTASSTAVTGTTKFMSKTIASPVQRAGKTTAVPPPASRRLASATTEGFAGSPLSAKTQLKKVLSPVKDPLGNMNDLPNNLDEVPQSRLKQATTTPLKLTRQSSKESIKPRPSPSPRSSVRSTGRSQSSSKLTLDPKQLRRSRTLPNHKSVGPREAKERALQPIHSTSENLCVPDGSRRIVPAPHSGSGPSESQSLSAVSRPPSSTMRPGSSKTASEVAYDKASLTAKPSFTVVSSGCDASSRTPSPELPNSLGLLTPEFKRQKSTMKVLGLGTPEVERWINAGKGEELKVGKSKGEGVEGKPKTVYFKDEVNRDEDSEEVEDLMERARKLSLQISPRRPVPSASGSTVDPWANLAVNSPAHSAISHPANTSAASSSPAATSTAHDLLKTIVQDVMFDFQRDTKAEMMGLHLDLLRMGRSWKAELRSLMDEYVGDLREMRDENERLRKENERLKRSWQ